MGDMRDPNVWFADSDRVGYDLCPFLEGSDNLWN